MPARAPIHDAFRGLAPAASTSCPRCGRPTVSFANGHSRVDICEPCGTLDGTTQEGLELFQMRDLRFTKGRGAKR